MIQRIDGEPPRVLLVAGGRGSRMAPSRSCPKPLVPVRGIPLIDIAIDRLLASGHRDLHFALGHRAEEIEEHVRRRVKKNAQLTFRREQKPLGTIGALSQMPQHDGTLLILNGDLLSGIDLDAMLGFHRQREAAMTIAVHWEEHRLALGEVVVDDDHRVTDYLEKPLKRYRISSGTYLVEPSLRNLVPDGVFMGIPELVTRAVREGRRVFEYLHEAPWIDVNDEAGRKRAEQMLTDDPGAFGVDRSCLS